MKADQTEVDGVKADVADNDADATLARHAMQDATRFIAYGIDHVRNVVAARSHELEALSGHLDLMENGLVGLLAAREFLEPLVVLSGGFAPVARLYRRSFDEYMERCESAGLGDRRNRSPVPAFLDHFRNEGSTA